jgi:NADH-quinone oxidoreductase subunit N
MNVIIISALLGVVSMLAGVFLKNNRSAQMLSNIAIIILMGASIYDFTKATNNDTYFYNNMVVNNTFIAKLNMIISFGAMLYIFLFDKAITKVGFHDNEYFALIMFSLCGVYIVTSYQSLFMLFLGIEIMSIPQYIMAGSDKRSFKSNEASLKYFLMGSFSTGFLLMGIALIYAATASFDLSNITMALTQTNFPALALLGIVFLIIAFGFKASAAPFHIWTPDVYDGTPTPFTPFMASIAKVAVFAAFIRLFHFGLGSFSSTWQVAITALIILTLLIGNITAAYQENVKRMLAYSSIAQAGFMLFAVFALGVLSYKGLLLYAATYTIATIGIFAVLSRLKNFNIDGFAGLAKENPIAGFTAVICLLSLAGIPLTGGFFAKYYMLQTAMQGGMNILLLIFAMLMAAVSVYYYFKVIRAIYFSENKTGGLLLSSPTTTTEKGMLVVVAIAIILIGILPMLATWF